MGNQQTTYQDRHRVVCIPSGSDRRRQWQGVESARPLNSLDFITANTAERSGSADGKLSLYEAWEIAMAWREPLLNKVRLVTACQGPKISIIDSIAWCGHENPVLCKCVFSEYATLPDKRDSGVVHSMDDSLGFFDQDGHVFPRFMLDGDGLEGGENSVAGLKLFCGVDGADMAPDVELKLCGVLRWLDPIVAQDRMSRQTDVCIGRVSRESLDALHAALPVISESQAVCGVDVVSLDQPTCRFRVSQVNLELCFKLRNDADVDKLVALMRDTTVTIGPADTLAPDSTAISTPAMATMVSCVLGLEGSSTKAKGMSIKLNLCCRPEAFLSALPFATTVHTIVFRADNYNDCDLAWLGYALFHPDTPTSSWKALVFNVSTLLARSASVIEAMARGNNLEALLSLKAPSSTAYYAGWLTADAVVMTKPSGSAECLVQARDVRTRVDVCGTPTNSKSTWKKLVGANWVVVIVPGYGLGWVRPHEVIDVEARPPSRASLAAAKILYKGREHPEFLPACMSCTGPSLRLLDIAGYKRIKPSSRLGGILLQCPRLVSLAVDHSGALWSELGDSEVGSLPRCPSSQLSE